MRVVVSGASGLVGAALTTALTGAGHDVVRLVRREAGEHEVRWDPTGGVLDPSGIEGADAVVHLAGESVAGGRWSKARKARIRDSRIHGTRVLVEAMGRCDRPPGVLVCASAVGFYGSRGDEVLAEGASAGAGFLAETCVAWEAEAATARNCGARVALARFGVILSPRGGALPKMLLPVRLGVGGIVGDGRQHMSWISLDDAVGAVVHLLARDDVEGPVNVVAPRAATNREFTKALGAVLGRPTILPLPGFVARLVLGEMADEMLLASQRCVPDVLAATGYEFRHPELRGALRHLLNR